MIPLATQTYIKIKREVLSTEQNQIEEKRTIFMYPDKIVTKHHEFLMKDVLDISYRKIESGGNLGILYIHTIGGLYPYTTKSSPNEFIDAFKMQKNKQNSNRL